MNKRLIIVFSFCMIGFLLQAKDNLRIPDIRTLGLGGIGTAHSALFNPALLALRTESEVRVDYYNRYSLKELATVSGGLCYRNDILPLGLHVASFGYDAYRESMFRFSVGKQLNTVLALGIGIQYALLQSELFETSASRLSTDIGASLRVVDNLLITASVINLPSITINSEGIDSERIASWAAEVGANWQVLNNLLITGGVMRNGETSFGAAIGMEYQPFKDFHLRAGLRSAPFRPSLGIGYRLSKFSAEVVMIYHPILGISTGLGVAYTF
ncbi:MAG: hypothetical protein LBE79_09405 [Tannerella sp.]|nr:hypothetical protein [Tannerella sp.]